MTVAAEGAVRVDARTVWTADGRVALTLVVIVTNLVVGSNEAVLAKAAVGAGSVETH